MQIDKELLKQVQQKYAAEEEPFMTAEDLKGRPGYEDYRGSDLERLAQAQNQGRIAQFAGSPGMQTAAAAGTGALGGGAIGGLLGGKAGILPGSVLGGLAMTIARHFFKDDFNKALQWLSAVMGRADAPEILEGVSTKLPAAEGEKVRNAAAGVREKPQTREEFMKSNPAWVRPYINKFMPEKTPSEDTSSGSAAAQPPEKPATSPEKGAPETAATRASSAIPLGRSFWKTPAFQRGVEQRA